MEGVNPFIKSNKDRMIMFLDELGNVPELPDTKEHFMTDLPRDLAALHQLCVSHSDELRTLSNERGAQQHVLKKLLAITEELQRRQVHYAPSNSNRQGAPLLHLPHHCHLTKRCPYISKRTSLTETLCKSYSTGVEEGHISSSLCDCSKATGIHISEIARWRDVLCIPVCVRQTFEMSSKACRSALCMTHD